MNLFGFLAVPHHQPARRGSKSPIEVPGAEGPHVTAPTKAARGTDPSCRWWLVPLAVALHPLPSAPGRVRMWLSPSPTFGHLSGSGSHFTS